jgi:hypothetical protein
LLLVLHDYVRELLVETVGLLADVPEIITSV